MACAGRRPLHLGGPESLRCLACSQRQLEMNTHVHCCPWRPRAARIWAARAAAFPPLDLTTYSSALPFSACLVTFV